MFYLLPVVVAADQLALEVLVLVVWLIQLLRYQAGHTLHHLVVVALVVFTSLQLPQ